MKKIIISYLLLLQTLYIWSEDPIRLLIFGDSTSERRTTLACYADILSKQKKGNVDKFSVVLSAISGENTSSLIARFQSEVNLTKPDFVILMYGINDSTYDVWQDPPKTTPRVSITQYTENINYIISYCRSKQIKIILMTPNPLVWTDDLLNLYGRPPYETSPPLSLNKFLASYADAIRDLGKKENLPVIDVYNAFLNYTNDPEEAVRFLTLDGMHPNQTGQTLIANLLEAFFAGSKLDYIILY